MTVLRPRRVRASARRKARTSAERARVRYEWDILAGTLRWGSGLDRLLGHAGGAQPWAMDDWCALLHPHEGPDVDAAMVRALDSEAVAWSAEYRLRRLDGSFVRVADRGRIERAPEGRALRLVGALLAAP